MKKQKRKHQPFYMKPYEWIIFIICIVLSLFFIVLFPGRPTVYELVIFRENNQRETLQYYHQYELAKTAWDQSMKQGDGNPAILENGKIIQVQYGIVNFKTKSCESNTSFYMKDETQVGYTNGCYGADGLFLGLSKDKKYVSFKQSGVVGNVSLSEVEILNIEDPRIMSTSYYQYKEGGLYHIISTDITKSPAASIAIGDPELLNITQPIYSYDGHYFYNSFQEMADDERIYSHKKAINAKNPYYSYYQYISHRSLSQYSAKDINWYIENYLGYHGKPKGTLQVSDSLLYQEGKSFISNQNKYGANAIMMFALAQHESAYGRSALALSTNNLFSHAAYDIAPMENANQYPNVATSIQAHAKVFISKGYLDPCDQSINIEDVKTCLNTSGNRYAGGFFGDKSGGMAVHYASDPYWGEKAANYYREFDSVMGKKDHASYTIGIIDTSKTWAFYQKPTQESPILFYTPNYETYAVLLLEKVNGAFYENSDVWYKVQSDARLNKQQTAIEVGEGNYRNQENVIYIPAQAIERSISQ